MEKIKTIIKELRIEIRFNELANNLEIRLSKGNKKFVLKFLILQQISAMEKI